MNVREQTHDLVKSGALRIAFAVQKDELDGGYIAACTDLPDAYRKARQRKKRLQILLAPWRITSPSSSKIISKNSMPGASQGNTKRRLS
jgi:hypothetical protein